jgi:hypothetical protein
MKRVVQLKTTEITLKNLKNRLKSRKHKNMVVVGEILTQHPYADSKTKLI